jgi:hypothetical protein
MTWQASWPPTRSRCDSRHPPDSNSSGVLGPARRGRGTVGDDLCVRPNHAALDPHERPVHWPSPRAQSWCSDGSPAKATSRSPARSSRSATATPARPSPCSSLAQSDQRIDRPLLPERPPSGRLVSGRLVSGRRGHAGVCGDLRPGRVSGRPQQHAGHQRGHRWPLRQPPRTCQLVRRAAGPGPGPLLPQATAVLVPACGPELPQQARGRPPCSATPWPACPPWCPPRPTGRLRRCPVSTGRADVAVTRPCAVRRRTLPQPVSVRGYRKRSPGRRPLVGCSHRRHARPSCRASRSRSCSRI